MLTVKFSKTYDDVLTQAYLFHSGLIRDLSLFTAYSPIFDADYASDFLDLIESAGGLPTNEEDLNNQVILSNDVESKMEESRAIYRKLISYVRLKWGNSDSVIIEERDKIINDLHVILRSMAMRAELKWGKKSPKYKWLGVSDLKNISIETFAARARTIHTFMSENLAELASEGLTQAMLDNLDAKILELIAAINLALDKENIRQEKTKERIILSNQIYKLVKKYCDIGKLSWINTNEAKYNDYLIYKRNK